MPSAFLLINTKSGFEPRFIDDLKKTKEVVDAFALYGVYDIIVKVEAESMAKLNEVQRRIRNLKWVGSTLTMIIIGEVLEKADV
jgi:DNA-binding Lrp family transcriptional regulator